MQTRAQFFVAVVAITGVMALPWTLQSEAKKEKQTRQIEELLKQRLDTLRKLVEFQTAQHRQETATYESLVRATDRLIEAELESAESREARSSILRRWVSLMEELVEMAKARFRTGRVTNAAVLAAHADHLKAKIQLARAEAEEQ